MKKPSIYPFALLLILGLATSQCTLDDVTPENPLPSLTLNVTTNHSLINLNWNPVNVTGFKEYVILQSAQNIPDSPTPPVDVNISVVKRIDERNVTSLSTTNTLLAFNLCYKLYVSVDDRFISSPTVCITPERNVLSGFNDKVTHYMEHPEIVMFDRVNTQLTVYNIDDNQVTNSILENNLSFPILDLSHHNGQYRLFTFDQSFNRIRRYSFPGLSFESQKNYSETILGGVASGDFVYMVLQGASGFQVLNANSLTVIDQRLFLSGNRNIAVFEGDPKTVLEIGDSGIMKYAINSVGKITAVEQFGQGVTQTSIQSSCDVSDQYYIGGRFATLVNRNGEVLQSLVSGINSFVQVARFSPDGTKALLVVIDQNVTSLDIVDISTLPTFTTLKSYELPVASYIDLFMKDDITHVIGVNFNALSEPTTIFFKFPL